MVRTCEASPQMAPRGRMKDTGSMKTTLKFHTWRALLFLTALASSALVLEAGKRWS